VIGNNSYMNQIRFRPGSTKVRRRAAGTCGNYLGDVDFERFADQLRHLRRKPIATDPNEIRPALERAESLRRVARIINCWVDPDAYAPGTGESDDVPREHRP